MKWEIKDFISLYAAVVSTIVLVWNMVSWRLNQGKLKFEVKETSQFGEDGKFDFYIEYKVINTGEKPVTISLIGYTVVIKERNQTGEGRLSIKDFSYRLEGHSSFLHYRKAPDIFAPRAHAESVFVEDALGRRCYVKKKHVKNLGRHQSLKAVTVHEPL